jgi:hypothetical protein
MNMGTLGIMGLLRLRFMMPIIVQELPLYFSKYHVVVVVVVVVVV